MPSAGRSSTASARSPETFIARGGDATTVVLFGIVVALVPALALGAVGLASRPLGATVRRRAHLLLVAGVGGVAAWRLGQDVTDWLGTAKRLVLLSVVAGLALAVLRWRLSVARTFLRFAGAVSVVFLAQFLLVSPSAELVTGDGPSLDAEVAADVSDTIGEEPPPVVMLVFDALPTVSLLDGEGRIDAELYPNFAELADSSTWYRNNSAVAAFTFHAVPAVLTGRLPEPVEPEGAPPPDPENLFTLLGGSYDVHAREQVTRLCPEELCAIERSGGLAALLGDAVSLWSTGVAPDTDDEELVLPGALGPGRYQDATSWIEQQDFGRGGRPKLFFYHAVLPHFAWEFLPDGTRYEGVDNLPAGFFAAAWDESGTGLEVGHQRVLLQTQAVDRLLGLVMDEMKATGTFDDALIVVTADHGAAFQPGEPTRPLTEGNASEIAWTPLIVKEPGQAVGDVNDDNVMVIDVVPTIAEVVDVDLPWSVDGSPLSRAGERDPNVKTFQDSDKNQLRAEEEGERVRLDARRGFAEVLDAEPVEGDGPDAIWQRTAHGDLLTQDVSDLDVGSPTGRMVEVERLADLEAFEAGQPPLLEVVGHTDVAEGAVVAYAVNGTIAAVGEVEWGQREGHRLAHALLPPDPFVDGANELAAYLVEGEPGAETLRPLTVR